MSSSPASSQEPITDSPWFWLYLFATTALVLLVLFRSKMDIRQADIERQHQARQMQPRDPNVVGSAEANAASPPIEISSPGKTQIGLSYLFVVLGIFVAVGWARLWYVRFRQKEPIEREEDSTNSSAS